MHILILGTRGVPAQHGGFETFAQDLSLFLIARNHRVTVYCQSEIDKATREDTWNEVRRVFIPSGAGALGTVLFDWRCILHATRESGVALTLGYNTGIFNLLLMLRGMPTVMNMDGIEWKRAKWSAWHRAWLWMNEFAGAFASDHLVADHPEISLHLQRHTKPSKITVIPYGADTFSSAPLEPLAQYGLTAKNYYLLVARPEPDNSILEIVRAYSRKSRDTDLVVLGNYSAHANKYHRQVLESAGPGVKFVGAIYDRSIVQSLRAHAKAYIHGHRVGGTNPSLVESLAAGNAIIAHHNPFTRWVAGECARYFTTSDHLAEILDAIESDSQPLTAMEQGSRMRHEKTFLQSRVLSAYENLLLRVSQRRALAGPAAVPRPNVSSRNPVQGVSQWAYRKADAETAVPQLSHQRRAAVRYELQIPVVFRWNDGIEHTESGFTKDISLNGALIYSKVVPPVGCDIRIESVTQAPGRVGEELRIECDAKVTRVADQEEQIAFGVHGIFDYEPLLSAAAS